MSHLKCRASHDCQREGIIGGLCPDCHSSRVTGKPQIMAGKTYENGNGTAVTIMGLAKTEPVEHMTIYWSLQGDWYSSDGRFVMTTRKKGHFLLSHDNYLSIDPDTGRNGLYCETVTSA